MSPNRKPLTYWLAAAALVLSGLACNTLAGPRPPVAWDTDPAAVVVHATFCCGLVPMTVALNYVPEVQIWGDGRIVWINQNNAGGRQVLTGTLTPDQMTALLQAYVDAGFFGWETNYGDYSITDGASQCVSVTLTSDAQQVCEYYRGAPAKFHDLYDLAANGAGATGVDFVPEQGYVTAYPQTISPPPAADTYLNWPASSFGLSLADATGGVWLEGEALAFAWRVVNGDSWQALVRDGDEFYSLVVIVPGISGSAPPPTPTPAPQ